MTERERLIELIRNAPKTDTVYGDIRLKDPVPTLQTIADHCLSNGVIVPPCKVGQWVYVPWHWEGQQAVAMVKVEEIKFYDSQMHYMFYIDMESDDDAFNLAFGGWKIGDSVGKTVFLTKEEAEKALKERSEGR